MVAVRDYLPITPITVPIIYSLHNPHRLLARRSFNEGGSVAFKQDPPIKNLYVVGLIFYSNYSCVF